MTVNHRLLVLMLCLVPAAALAQQPAPNPTTPAEPQVVVTGEGMVQAVPDRAWITISAESRAANPRDAQRRNTEAMTPVLEKLKAAGVIEVRGRMLAILDVDGLHAAAGGTESRPAGVR